MVVTKLEVLFVAEILVVLVSVMRGKIMRVLAGVKWVEVVGSVEVLFCVEGEVTIFIAGVKVISSVVLEV